ncbi:glycosyltransferase, partial [Klebsiella pneumoniae]|nr:glycosyltransferase [Klebsiella pneumoniae]
MGGKTFMLMAGGTGGHIFPALAVADSLRARGHHVIWLGSKDSMEERIVPQYGIRLETLAIKGVRGNGIKRKLMLPVTLYQTVREAQRIIRKHRVECVIGFGGFVTFPGGLAAKLLGVPIVIHEQNAVAGLSNRHLSRWA